MKLTIHKHAIVGAHFSNFRTKCGLSLRIFFPIASNRCVGWKEVQWSFYLDEDLRKRIETIKLWKRQKSGRFDGDLFLSLMLVSVVVCLLQGYGVAEIGGVVLGVLIQNGAWNQWFVCCSWWSLVMLKLWQEELMVDRWVTKEDHDSQWKDVWRDLMHRIITLLLLCCLNLYRSFH